MMVNWPMSLVVDDAVYWAVHWVLDDPPHLALRDFLSGYADRGAP
jgi:hypothetical protein